MQHKTAFAASLLTVILVTVTHVVGQAPANEQKLIRDFEGRAKAYIKFRDKVRKSIPKVSKKAEQAAIDAYQTRLQQEVIRRRQGAKEGNLFTPATVVYFRTLIKKEFPGFEASELRKQVFEADTKGVQAKVNVPYPDDKELVAMPPPLLIALPQLPPDLRYRFIGRSLVLIDRDGSLILDVMRDALP